MSDFADDILKKSVATASQAQTLISSFSVLMKAPLEQTLNFNW